MGKPVIVFTMSLHYFTLLINDLAIVAVGFIETKIMIIQEMAW